MQFSALSLGVIERTATVSRSAMVALAALAVALDARPPDPDVALLGVGYLAAAGAVWLLAPRPFRASLIYPLALADTAAITTFIILPPESPFPLWVLYLFPVASTAAIGQLPAAAAAGLSVAGYLGALWLNGGGVPPPALWPVAVLAAAALLVTTLSTRWLVERRAKRAWQEIAAAVRNLSGGTEAHDVPCAVAERARRLVRAEQAWLWWYDDAGRLFPGPRVGRVSEHPTIPESLPPAQDRRLDQKPIPLEELNHGFSNLPGELVALRHGESRLALLAVIWHHPPRDRAALREKLRVFAPWGGDALAQARTLAAARDELRRESVLLGVAAGLAAALDRREAQEIVINAVRSELRAAVSLVDRSSGRLVGGDAEVTEALVRLTVDAETSAQGAKGSAANGHRSAGPWSAMIDENLALMAWRADPPLRVVETAWLDRLAAVARGALVRCAEHDRLRTEEDRLRATLEAMPAPLTLWTADGVLVLANGAHRALECSPVPPKEPLPATTREEEILLGEPPRTFVATTVPVAAGRHTVVLYREITREREALRAKDELIAMVGHELRTPLTSIHGYSQLMGRQLGVVQRQVEQLNRLIGDFMEAAQGESLQLALIREPVDLVELARRAAERFRGAHEGRRLRLELGPVPAVEGDPARLGQVLDNLLANAAKYSAEDQEIVITVGVGGEEVILSVQDHGVGIAPEHLTRLFDRFYRVPGTDTEQVTGLGLGLSIARDLVAAHGGRIWVESDGHGKGSTFRVSLPVPAASHMVRRLKAIGNDRAS